MATFTFLVGTPCSGGEHVPITVKRNGVAIKTTCVLKSEVMNPAGTWEDVIVILMRQAILAAGATTPAQMKTAVQAMSVSI